MQTESLTSDLTFPATWTPAPPVAEALRQGSGQALRQGSGQADTVEVVSDEASFAALESPWNEAVDRARVTHPFLRHEWFRTWWECFGAGRELRIMIVRRDGRIAAIAPLMLERARICHVPVRRLAFLQNDHTPRADFIIADRRRESYDAIWRALFADRRRWDVLQLNQLPPDSATRQAAADWARRSRFRTGVWRCEESPYLDISGAFADFTHTLTPKFRQNLRNRMGRLRKLGEPALELIAEPRAIRGAVPDAIRLEASGWKNESNTSIAADSAVHQFYTLLAGRAAERGWLRLAFLKLGDRRIAASYSAQYDNRFFLIKTGYDPQYAACSPFKVLSALLIERAFDEGLREFDFGGDAEPWKLEWTSATRPLDWLFVFSRTPAARLAHFMKFQLRHVLTDISRALGR